MELPLVGNTRPTLQVNYEPNSKPSPRSQIWVHTLLFQKTLLTAFLKCNAFLKSSILKGTF